MKELRELAGRLLAEGSVKVVVGYEEGPSGVRPVLITRSEDAQRLVFDHRCVHNLATYLSPRRRHLRGLGRPAVVIKGCDARAVAGMIRESQLKREDVVLIGVRCGGVVDNPASMAPLTADNVADRCPGCADREPRLADHIVGELPPEPPGEDRRTAAIARVDAMTVDERLAFWKEELSRCVRCHACREVCPMCFCERCLADKTDPQWVESSAHPRGNFVWHVSRAIHLAGRCVDCGECERICPANIQLNLISRKLAQVVRERYGYTVCDDPSVPAPIGAYRTEDGQEFIR